MSAKKISSHSLSALVFALGAGSAAHAAEEVNIQNLELSEESALSLEEFERVTMDRLVALSAGRNWGGSGSSIRSGNYANSIRAGNYANSIRAGNYADSIRAGNYANSVRAGNYGRIWETSVPDVIPEPRLAEQESGGAVAFVSSQEGDSHDR